MWGVGKTPHLLLLDAIQPVGFCSVPTVSPSGPPYSKCMRGTRALHGRKESNPQPAVLETAALPIELHPYGLFSCARQGRALDRTPDRQPFLVVPCQAKGLYQEYGRVSGLCPMVPVAGWLRANVSPETASAQDATGLDKVFTWSLPSVVLRMFPMIPSVSARATYF